MTTRQIIGYLLLLLLLAAVAVAFWRAIYNSERNVHRRDRRARRERHRVQAGQETGSGEDVEE